MAFPDRSNPQAVRDHLSKLENISSILWIILSIGMCATCFGALLGLYNLSITVRRRRDVRALRDGWNDIPQRYDDREAEVYILLIANLVFGGALGVPLAFLDYYIRDKVLQHRELFDGAVPGTMPDTGG